MEPVVAERAIKWTCGHCGYEQYSDDTLMVRVGGQYTCPYDRIICDACGEDNEVISFE